MMLLMLIRNSLHVIFLVSMVASKQLSIPSHTPIDISISAKNVTYIEIDHDLRPRRIEDINDMSPLPVFPGKDSEMKKYPVYKKQIQEIILGIEENKDINNINTDQPLRVKDNGSWKNESEIRKTKLKSVLGTDGEVYYDADWGLMSAILTCYNNHWALKTGPEDWWTVAIRRIVQAMDKHGEVPQVRDFFVEHKEKKKIDIIVGSTLSNINYNWLFSQFSNGIRENIKVPGYVDIIENDFSSSTDEQTMISQIMLMSSMKNYFDFGMTTMCGIPGIEMKGTEADWVKLVDKINNLEKLLTPIDKYLGLERWFNTAKIVFANLLDTFRGNPNIEWWVQILSWNERWGSGMRPHWSGWFPDFFGVKPYSLPGEYIHFPSDLVTVPIHIKDSNNPPPVEDDGILVAGIVGFNVEEGERSPVVEPMHAWSLLLPEDSLVAERLTGSYRGSESVRHSTPEQQLTSVKQTISTADTEIGEKRVCRYYCKEEFSKYVCCQSFEQREIFANSTIVIRDDNIHVNICKFWCKGLDNEIFCCYTDAQWDLYAHGSSTDTLDETESDAYTRSASSRNSTHRQQLTNNNRTVLAETESVADTESTTTRHSTHRQELTHNNLTDQAEAVSEAETRSASTRHSNHRQQHNNNDLTALVETEADTETRSASTGHSNHRQQINNNDLTVLVKTESDADRRSASTRNSTHRQQITTKNPIIFPTEAKSDANTGSGSKMHSTRHHQPTNKNPTVTPEKSQSGSKSVCKFYCKEEYSRYVCCEISQLRAFFENTTIVIRDDDTPENVCKFWCLGLDNKHFCCYTAHLLQPTNNNPTVLAETESDANTGSTTTRHSTHRQQLTNDNPTVTSAETKLNANTGSVSKKHSTRRKQHNKLNPIATPADIQSDTNARSASTWNSNHHQQLPDDDSVVFPTEQMDNL